MISQPSLLRQRSEWAASGRDAEHRAAVVGLTADPPVVSQHTRVRERKRVADPDVNVEAKTRRSRRLQAQRNTASSDKSTQDAVTAIQGRGKAPKRRR